MRTPTLALLAVFVPLLGAGCVVAHDNPQPQPLPQPQGPPTYRIQPGGSTVVFPGTQAGYGITANVGGSYRAVWTGEAPTHYNRFTGSIYTPGHFTGFDPGCGGVCPDENGDIIDAPVPVAGGGEQITFDTFATDGLDGLDFSVSGEPVEFDLAIDGAAYPDLVFFPSADTGTITSPAQNPFDLTTH